MSRRAAIREQKRAFYRRLALENELQKLLDEERLLPDDEVVDLSREDDDQENIKVERLEQDDTVVHQSETHEATQNINSSMGAYVPDHNSRQLPQARQQHVNESSGHGSERGGSTHDHNVASHQPQHLNSQQNPGESNPQPYMGGLPLIDRQSLRRQHHLGNDQRVQQWRQSMPGHGPMEQNLSARDNSVAPTGLIVDQQARSPANNQQHWFREDSPGQIPSMRDDSVDPTGVVVDRQVRSPANNQQHLFPQGSPGHTPSAQAVYQTVPQQALGATHTENHQSVQSQPFGIARQVQLEQSEPIVLQAQTTLNIGLEHHPVFTTLILFPDGRGYRELRCHICKGNISKTARPTEKKLKSTSNGQGKKGKASENKSQEHRFFSGIKGFQSHFQFCHPSECEDQKQMSATEIFEKCRYRDLSHEQVISMMHSKGGYKIEAVPGASADKNSCVKRPRQRRKAEPEAASSSAGAPRAGRGGKMRKTLADGGKQAVKNEEQQDGTYKNAKRRRNLKNDDLGDGLRQERIKRKLYVLNGESDDESDSENEEPLRRVYRTRKRDEATVTSRDRESTYYGADALITAVRGDTGMEEQRRAGGEADADENQDEE